MQERGGAAVRYGTVIPALVTAMDGDGAIDFGRTAELARRLVDEGADGMLVGGTTAESPTLTDDDKLRLLSAVLEAVGDRVFVWAGTGTNDTRASAKLTRRAADAGAHGIMLVTPYYNKPPQEGLYRHFKAVAETVPLPVMLYNVPGRTGTLIAPETVARLAEVPNIVAIKEASGSLDQVSAERSLAPGVVIYSGNDGDTLALLALGAVGVVSVAAHVAAGPLAEMIAAFGRGDHARAEELHRRLHPLFKALFVTTNPIPVKRALQLQGFDTGPCRPPLCAPTPREDEQIRQALARLQETEQVPGTR